MDRITQDAARVIIHDTMAYGKDKGMKPLSVAVVDAGGHVLAFERADGAPPGRFDIARARPMARSCWG